ncbi:hypothetical protein SCUP515_06278 [Seiridium cupressi]
MVPQQKRIRADESTGTQAGAPWEKKAAIPKLAFDGFDLRQVPQEELPDGAKIPLRRWPKELQFPVVEQKDAEMSPAEGNLTRASALPPDTDYVSIPNKAIIFKRIFRHPRTTLFVKDYVGHGT